MPEPTVVDAQRAGRIVWHMERDAKDPEGDSFVLFAYHDLSEGISPHPNYRAALVSVIAQALAEIDHD